MINSDEMSEESLEESLGDDGDDDEEDGDGEDEISLISSSSSHSQAETVDVEGLEEENSELHQLCLEEKQENLIERIQNLLQNGADPTQPNQV